MIKSTALSEHVNPKEFITSAVKATTVSDVEALLAQLPIVSPDDFSYNKDNPTEGWQEGKFHWIPVGRDRGNAGRVKTANHPVNPLAERTVNGMEALIELARQREILAAPGTSAPKSPREAVERYFGLPPLDSLHGLGDSEASKRIRAKAREMARALRVKLRYDKSSKEFAVAIEDDGIGQAPENVHRTLLSLGSTTKAEHWYLIGVFGQGGSSAFACSKCSWLMSRRAPDLLGGATDGVGWTVVRHVFPRGRRDDYYAYLAASPEGHVPFFEKDVADSASIGHGTRFVHVDYNFGGGSSSIMRQLYQTLNHVLYNPVLPFDTDAGGTEATVYGNGYRLSSLGGTKKTQAAALDKVFSHQPVAL